jgi:hypothetical protein
LFHKTDFSATDLRNEHSTYSDFSNPAEWDKACTGPNVVIDELEPMVDEPTSYRRAAQSWLELLKAIDFWLATSSDTRLAWVSVAITLNLTSTRGMASAEIARQLGVTEGALTRSNAKFMKLTGLGARTAT